MPKDGSIPTQRPASSRLFVILSVLIAVILTLAFMARALPLLVHPTLHVDESYYIGAARRILAGDLLLTGYGFDKLFLLPYLLSPGLLFAGESAVGFRIAGLVFTVANIYLFRKVLRLALSRTSIPDAYASGPVSSVFSTLVSFAIFLQPLMLAHGISAMAEPALIFFLLLGAKRLLEPESLSSANALSWARPWTLASLVKLSSIMWLPFFILAELFLVHPTEAPHTSSDLTRSIRSWTFRLKSLAHAFWTHTKWLWILSIIFMAMNRQKFAPLAWFSHLFKDKPEATGLLARVSFWIQTFQGATFNVGALLWLAIAVSLVLSLRDTQTRFTMAGRWRAVILISTLLHAIGLPLSGAPLYERYLAVLLPQFAIAAVVALLHLTTYLPRRRQLALRWLAPFVFAVLSLYGAFLRPSLPLEPNPSPGRALEAMRDVLPDRASLISPHLWETRPYENQDWFRDTCADNDCLWRARPRPSSNDQYIVLRTPESYSLEQAPLVLDRQARLICYQSQTFSRTLPLKRPLAEAFADRVRLKGSDLEIKFHGMRRETVPLGHATNNGLFALGRRDLLDGLPVEVEVRVKDKRVSLRGRLIVVNPFGEHATEDDPGLALWIESLSSPILSGAIPSDFVLDLLAVIWKSRVLKLVRVDVPPGEHGFGSWRLLGFEEDSASVYLQRDIVQPTSAADCI